MSHDNDELVDPCPPVILPPDVVFPVRVDVPICGLLLRDAEDLADLNRYLNDIRRIPQRKKTVREPDPDGDATFATFLWLDEQRKAGKFVAYPGQWVVGIDTRILGIGPDADEIIQRALEADPTLRTERVVVIDIPDPKDFILTR